MEIFPRYPHLGDQGCYNERLGSVAQLVEQRIENPRVGSSILPQATKTKSLSVRTEAFFVSDGAYLLAALSADAALARLANSARKALSFSRGSSLMVSLSSPISAMNRLG
ncbi:MAG: hypothetical protein RLZ00_982 [Pseudomonadota bacterium]